MHKFIMITLLLIGLSKISVSQDFVKYDLELVLEKTTIAELNKKLFEEIDNYFNYNYFSKDYSKTEMSGTGYYPYQRYKYFFDRHVNENGEIPFLKRWKAFEDSKEQLFKPDINVPTANWIEVGPTNRGGAYDLPCIRPLQ